MSGLFNSPPGTFPMTRRTKSAFDEGQDSILDLLREPDPEMLRLVTNHFGATGLARTFLATLAALLKEKSNAN